jgi:hypothetical protein
MTEERIRHLVDLLSRTYMLSRGESDDLISVLKSYPEIQSRLKLADQIIAHAYSISNNALTTVDTPGAREAIGHDLEELKDQAYTYMFGRGQGTSGGNNGRS